MIHKGRVVRKSPEAVGERAEAELILAVGRAAARAEPAEPVVQAVAKVEHLRQLAAPRRAMAPLR